MYVCMNVYMCHCKILKKDLHKMYREGKKSFESKSFEKWKILNYIFNLLA